MSNPIENGKSYLTHGERGMVNKKIKRCLTSLVMRELHI